MMSPQALRAMSFTSSTSMLPSAMPRSVSRRKVEKASTREGRLASDMFSGALRLCSACTWGSFAKAVDGSAASRTAPRNIAWSVTA